MTMTRVASELPPLLDVRELMLAYEHCPHSMAIDNSYGERIYARCRAHRDHGGEHQWVAL